MNKSSIFLKLNIIFTLAIVSIITTSFLIYNSANFHYKKRLIEKGVGVYKTILIFSRFYNFDKLDDILENRRLKLIDRVDDAIKILQNSKVFIESKDLSKYGNLKILSYKGELYFSMVIGFRKFILKDKSVDLDYQHYIIIISLMLLFIITTLYIMLRKSLLPLKNLEFEIKKYGQGSLDIDTKTDRKDEVSLVANEFHNAVERIKSIKQARTLFLRNIMHELKTPITKGRISLELIDENFPSKKILRAVFQRLELLINEMADIERVTSGVIELNIKSYRLIDILEESIDLLFIDETSICSNISNQRVEVDFKLFSIVVKNLIDNAIKYSIDSRVDIEFRENKLYFKSFGDRLEYPFLNYLEPFFKGELTKENQKGFGLGLYISNQILKRHKFNFKYSYIEGQNIFYIDFKRKLIVS